MTTTTTETTDPDIGGTIADLATETITLSQTIVEKHGLLGSMAKAAPLTVLIHAIAKTLVDDAKGDREVVANSLKVAFDGIADTASLFLFATEVADKAEGLITGAPDVDGSVLVIGVDTIVGSDPA